MPQLWNACIETMKKSVLLDYLGTQNDERSSFLGEASSLKRVVGAGSGI